MNGEQENRLDGLITQSLQEFPLTPAPDQLKARIMARIEGPVPGMRFRISWVDLALSGTLALLIGLAIDFIQDLTRSPYWSTRFQVSLALFWQDIRYFLLHNQPSVLTAALSAGIILSLGVILASVYWRYAAASSRLASY